MRKNRKKTEKVNVRGLEIGGNALVSVQSMTNLPIEDVKGTVKQIQDLVNEGADLVRVAVRNEDSIEYLKEIRKAVDCPLSADVHFNYRIAIEAIKAGIDKVRINPGNIGSAAKVKEVLKAAKDHKVPIRIGVNGGSVDREKFKEVTPATLVESALEHVRILEDNDFHDIVVSIKSSDVFQTIEANTYFSEIRNYPLHLGLTEAGYGVSCTVQSSVAIGHLLLKGIGDTIRVSMTGDPVEEITIGKKILEAAGQRKAYLRIVSCPTCGRTDPSLDLLSITKSVEKELSEKFGGILKGKDKQITIAVMGCEVNGPGEASHADFGVAGGRNGYMTLFSGGNKLKKIKAEEAVIYLIKEIENMLGQ
ncbi:MAG: flavodoxin-dependent (E)-4-hydroxy-3-methylbut-2-enyl-diphosphate synthase [Spirochaetes bacterium]|nr:flavodoxin-dependent (E)-4-hydroxy-3-methylbut-2-enyl-diphosphate synthase [Spirochaetota bacterium]